MLDVLFWGLKAFVTWTYFMEALGSVNCTFFYQKNLIFFRCKFFSMFCHQNSGSFGSVFILKCWIRIRNQWIRIPNTAHSNSYWAFKLTILIGFRTLFVWRKSILFYWNHHLLSFGTNTLDFGSRLSSVKGAQAWDIRSLGFSWFLHHKVSTCGRLQS